MLESHAASTPPPIKGSVMLARAASAEEVLAQLQEDVYAAEVWDLDRVQIIPVSGFLFFGFGFLGGDYDGSGRGRVVSMRGEEGGIWWGCGTALGTDGV